MAEVNMSNQRRRELLQMTDLGDLVILEEDTATFVDAGQPAPEEGYYYRRNPKTGEPVRVRKGRSAAPKDRLPKSLRGITAADLVVTTRAENQEKMPTPVARPTVVPNVDAGKVLTRRANLAMASHILKEYGDSLEERTDGQEYGIKPGLRIEWKNKIVEALNRSEIRQDVVRAIIGGELLDTKGWGTAQKLAQSDGTSTVDLGHIAGALVAQPKNTREMHLMAQVLANRLQGGGRYMIRHND